MWLLALNESILNLTLAASTMTLRASVETTIPFFSLLLTIVVPAEVAIPISSTDMWISTVALWKTQAFMPSVLKVLSARM